MQMIGQESTNVNDKRKKLLLLSMIAIVVMIVIIFVLLLFLKNYKPAEGIELVIDEKKVEIAENLIVIEGETNKVYFNIKAFAPYINYEPHNGEYKVYSEDLTKCYIENEYETASFQVEKNLIYKSLVDDAGAYDEYVITDVVKAKEGELYVSEEGMEIAANIAIKYEKDNNRIIVETLPYIYNYYNEKVIENGFSKLDDEFENQKAIMKGLFVVENTKGKKGVINNEYKEIISCRYNQIKYNSVKELFVVTNEQGKLGIIDRTGKTKIDFIYKELIRVNKNPELYLTRNDEQKYGIIDAEGKIIVFPECVNIGIASKNFKNDKIENEFIFYENIIPIQKNLKWGFVNIKGNVVTELIYDKIGCNKKPTIRKAETFEVALIQEYNAFVVCKNDKYGVVDSTGKELIPCGLTSIYSVNDSGKKMYYMEYQGAELNVLDYLSAVTKSQ